MCVLADAPAASPPRNHPLKLVEFGICRLEGEGARVRERREEGREQGREHEGAVLRYIFESTFDRL